MNYFTATNQKFVFIRKADGEKCDELRRTEVQERSHGYSFHAALRIEKTLEAGITTLSRVGTYPFGKEMWSTIYSDYDLLQKQFI